ncbi:MAG: hypothetical protein IJZ76_08020 [Lachnospiraceae bacterium]|nr:hypothetical protein [Lachnospiraceae bacterium]
MRSFTKVVTADNRKVFLLQTDALALLQIGESDFSRQQAEAVLEEVGAKVLLAVGKISDRITVSCLSLTEHIRALELIDYLFGQYGVAKGTAMWAVGSISEVLLSVCMSEQDVYDMTAYFLKHAEEYFTECDTIFANTYTEEYPQQFAQMKEYEKARVSWAYVKATDIVPSGVEISIHTLENDTGVRVQADEETYIMIGCLGEVYQIHQDKFEASYEPSEEKLDIFTQMLDFIPAVERMDDGSYLTIDEQAHLCYPKPGASILAGPLERRTRVFTKNGTDYFLGKQGDYLAVRKDDPKDVYIIQSEVFGRTYVEKGTGK